MRTILITIFCSLISINVWSQDNKAVDSLWVVVEQSEIRHTLEDTSLILVYNNLAEKIFSSNLDTAIYLIENSIGIGKDLLLDNIDTSRVNFHLATAYMNKGVVLYMKGANQESEQNYLKAIKLADQTNNQFVKSSALNNIGVLYYLKGDIPNAIKYTEDGLALKSGEASKDLVDSYSNLGQFYYMIGNVKKTIFYFDKAIQMCSKIDYKIGEATILNNVGLVQYYQGNYEKALENWKKALAIRKEINDLSGISNSLANIAALLDDQKKYDQAKAYYIESIEINLKLENKLGLVESYNNLGILFENTKDKTKAIEYYLKAYELSVELNNTNYIGIMSKNLSALYLAKADPESARKYSKIAYELGHKIKYPKLMKLSAASLGDVEVYSKNYLAADTLFHEFIDITNRQLISNFETLSEKEQEKYFKTVEKAFMNYNSYAYFRKNQAPEIVGDIYNNTLKNKGLLLKSSTALRNSILSSNDSLLIKQYHNWIDIKKEIATKQASGEDYSKLSEKANSLEKELVKGSSDFSDFKSLQNVNWQNVKENLKSNEAAIEFIHFKYVDFGIKQISERETDSILYCALLLKPDMEYPIMIPLFEEKELELIIGKFGGNNLKYVQNLYQGTELYETIWQPIKPHLKNTKTVYLSPSGLLHRISFSALKLNQKVLLCDEYKLNVKSSTAKLVGGEDKTLNFNDYSATIFGGINYDSPKSEIKIWDYLKGTEVEANQINGLLTKQLKTMYFSGLSATEKEFKESCSQANIIHIATHGFFYEDPSLIETNIGADDSEQGDIAFRGGKERGTGVAKFVNNDNPLMRSGLVFSKANDVWNIKHNSEEEDGVLTAAEVSHLDLRSTDLVVLSACETGLGDIKDSEGVYGLQRSFKMAGVNYVIMSLWQVPDKETKEFMILFYKYLLKTKHVEKSFLKTQSKMRAKYPPYYWAAFVLFQ